MALPALGDWWHGGSGASTNPLSGYADRMRAAGAAVPPVSPLVAGYTPPAYQTTPPHVDVNAIIAAMNASKAQPQVPGMDAMQQPMMPPGVMEGGAGTAGNSFEANNWEGNAGGNAGSNAAAEGGPGNGGPSAERGFMQGGYTGDAPITQDVGDVHGKEYVLNAPAVAKVGTPTLDKINDGSGDSAAIAKKVADRVAAKNDRRPMKGDKDKK